MKRGYRAHAVIGEKMPVGGRMPFSYGLFYGGRYFKEGRGQGGKGKTPFGEVFQNARKSVEHIVRRLRDIVKNHDGAFLGVAGNIGEALLRGGVLGEIQAQHIPQYDMVFFFQGAELGDFQSSVRGPEQRRVHYFGTFVYILEELRVSVFFPIEVVFGMVPHRMPFF